MLLVQNLTVQFGGRYLYQDVSFTVKERDRVGLAGKNGAGKIHPVALSGWLRQAGRRPDYYPTGVLYRLFATGYWRYERQDGV